VTDPVSERYKEALRKGHEAVVHGRPADAVRHYEEAGRLAQQRPLPFVSMGTVYLQMRRPQEALAAFDEALRRAPGDVPALRGKARALEAAGRRDEAAQLARRAAELTAMEQAGRPGAATGPDDGRDPEGLFLAASEARERAERDQAVGTFLEAAVAYAERNQWAAATDACFRALETSPGDVRVHLAMAGLYLRRGWPQLGVERLTLVLRLLDVDPDPDARAAVQDLARDFHSLDPALELMARRGA
jgi:thioredoxin-like negative regulator of GroEL